MVCACVHACMPDVITLTAQLMDDNRNTVLHANVSVNKHTSELYDDVGVGLVCRNLNHFKLRCSVLNN